MADGNSLSRGCCRFCKDRNDENTAPTRESQTPANPPPLLLGLRLRPLELGRRPRSDHRPNPGGRQLGFAALVAAAAAGRGVAELAGASAWGGVEQSALAVLGT